jgi:hypothetical protein
MGLPPKPKMPGVFVGAGVLLFNPNEVVASPLMSSEGLLLIIHSLIFLLDEETTSEIEREQP